MNTPARAISDFMQSEILRLADSVTQQDSANTVELEEFAAGRVIRISRNGQPILNVTIVQAANEEEIEKDLGSLCNMQPPTLRGPEGNGY